MKSSFLSRKRPERLWSPSSLSFSAHCYLASGKNWLEREADHSPAVVKNAWSCTFTLLRSFIARCLFTHRNSFTFF